MFGHKRVGYHERNGGYHNERILQEIRETILGSLQLGIENGGGINHIHHQNFPQNNLEGEFVPVGKVDKGVEIGVPMAHRIVEGKYSENRLGKGQYYADKKAGVVTAIYGSRLKKFFRYIVLKECPADDKVKYPDGTGEQHGPAGIYQMKPLHENIIRDEAATKNHRESKEKHQKPPAFHFRPGKRIGRQDGHYQIYHGPRYHIEEGILKTTNNLGVLKGRLVPLQRKVHGPEKNPSGGYRTSGTKGRA
jgi:hypothetical protein